MRQAVHGSQSVAVFGADLQATGLEIDRTSKYGVVAGHFGRAVIADARVASTRSQ